MKFSYKFNLPQAPARAPQQDALQELPVSLPPEIWSIPPLAMVAFPGFACVSTRAPITFQHPAGHVAIITVRKIDGAPTTEQMAQAAAAGRLEVEEIFVKVSAQHSGNVSTASFDLPEGVHLSTLRVTPTSFAGPKYFLMYAAVSPEGHLALVTVEGPGLANDMGTKLDPIMKAVRFAT